MVIDPRHDDLLPDEREFILFDAASPAVVYCASLTREKNIDFFRFDAELYVVEREPDSFENMRDKTIWLYEFCANVTYDTTSVRRLGIKTIVGKPIRPHRSRAINLYDYLVRNAIVVPFHRDPEKSYPREIDDGSIYSA